MSEWDDRVNGHQAIQLVRQLAAAVSPLSLEKGSLEDTAALHRAKEATAHLERLVNAADAELIAPAILERMVAPAQGAVAAAEAFATSNEIGQLATLNANLDMLLDFSAALIVAAPILSKRQQTESVSSFRETATKYLEALQQEARALAEEITAARQQAAEENRLSSERIDAQKASLATLEASIDSQKGRLDTAISDFQKQFLESEATRQKSATDSVTAVVDDLRATAGKGITELEGFKQQAETLVDAVGAAALGGGYRKYAVSQGRAAWFLFTVGVLALGAVTVGGLKFLETIGNQPFTLQDLWLRLVIVIPLLAISGIAIAQSGGHRANERKAKKAELELAALGPYIALLPKETQEKIRADMVERFFGQAEDSQSGGEAIGSSQIWDELVKVISAILPGKR